MLQPPRNAFKAALVTDDGFVAISACSDVRIVHIDYLVGLTSSICCMVSVAC